MLSLRNFEKSPAIWSISVDSRSRPAGEPVNRYHIELNNNLQRVRTVQLGSIYIPAQAIQAIGDTLNNNVAYMEPIQFAAPATLVLQETLTVRDLTTNAVTTTTFPSVTVTFPPTLNPIVSVADPAFPFQPNAVVTTLDHGLQAGTLEWANAGLNISVVGGVYPAPVAPSTTSYGPQVTSTTIDLTTLGATTFDFVPGYLNTLAAPNHAPRNTVGAIIDYVYAEPPTLSELLMMLNHWLGIINNPSNLAPVGSTLINTVSFSLNDANNSLGVSASTYSMKIGNQLRTVTTSLLNTGTLNSVLGITGNLLLTEAPRYFSLSSLPLFQQAFLDHGTYLQDELATMVTCKLSPLDFTGVVAADRTFHWADTGGLDRALIIPEGRYTGAQLALYLQGAMQNVTANANYSATFAGGKFTFSSTVNSNIGLNFLLGSKTLASKMGFQYINYSGAPSFTSPFSIGTSFPVTGFQLTGDSVAQRFTLSAKSVPTVLSNSTVGGVLNWSTRTAAAADFVPGGFYPNQVVQFTLAGAGPFPAGLAAGDVLTGVIGAAWPGTFGGVNPPYVTLLNTPSIAAIGGIQQPTANVNVYITPLRRPVTEFLFATPQAAAELLGFTKQTVPVNPSLGQVLNADEPNVYYLAGPAPLFGLGAASSFTGPFLYNLLGPDYILMRVLNDCDANTSNEHSYQEKSWNILAKMYLRPNYQHISEEMLHVAFAGMKRISSLYVEFINPDGSLVDFNGRDHTYTLLFTAEIKYAANICM
jgi:hypothetical protein